MRMDDRGSSEYESVSIRHIDFVDPYAIEGLIVLRSCDGREFVMRSFSGDVAKQIKLFAEGNERTGNIYSMFEEMCEQHGDVLVQVKIYGSGDALRANLYLAGKKETVLRNYKASDAVALAVFYGIPILVRRTLLKKTLDA